MLHEVAPALEQTAGSLNSRVGGTPTLSQPTDLGTGAEDTLSRLFRED